MKQIALFGAGKSASVLIDYLKAIAVEKEWKVTVADNNLEAVQQKVGVHPMVTPVQLDIQNEAARKALVQSADVVISLMPPALHNIIAGDCLLYKKHLLTASYVDDEIKAKAAAIQDAGILFLCEMGLDPGIDHMSAMELIHSIKAKGAQIVSFKSHCGGLVAPESDDNPWHYKISWNPRNVVLAGKAGAHFKLNGKAIHVPYDELFHAPGNAVSLPDKTVYNYYPNRDSLSYIPLYHLEEADTFLRTTLRHWAFYQGWRNVIDLKLTNEDKIYETDGMTYAQFFQKHLKQHGFGKWLNELLMHRLNFAKEMMEKLRHLFEAEKHASDPIERWHEEIMMVNEEGKLNEVTIHEMKDHTASSIAMKMQEANTSLSQLFFLGLENHAYINKGLCSAADIIQYILEEKLALKPHDKDLVVMVHEIDYILDGKKKTVQSYLKVKGQDSVHTAMAKTVGLPLGIAATLILDGKITTTGLHIPTVPEIYTPVLAELQKHGIAFTESTTEK